MNGAVELFGKLDIYRGVTRYMPTNRLMNFVVEKRESRVTSGRRRAASNVSVGMFIFIMFLDAA